MAANDSIILNIILDQEKSNIAGELPDEEFFELFTFEQILKKYEPSYAELQYGKIGGGDDGGIDGFFTFINKKNLTEDTEEKENFGRDAFIELFLIQSKRSTTFSENTVAQIITTVMEIFDLKKDMSVLQKHYNTDLMDKVDSFRQVYRKLAALHPILEVTYIYASKGDTASIHHKVYNKAEQFKDTICTYLPGANANVKFVGARELIDYSRLEKSYTLQLKFIDSISSGENNYVLLASLKDYYDFVTYENNDELRQYIFTFNVRDYQGNNVAVNKDIKETLESDKKIDFWWLNNGITILASKASIVGKTISLDDVQVVNGLQTTNTIFNYLKNQDVKDENRSILIKIVVTNDSITRDRVIKATNFQTTIPDASLKATDPIQADIENYFLSKEWFYDRRKNYYKNLRKPINRIISIPYLAQVVIAIVYREPNISRATPSSIIKKDSDYKRVFNQKLNPDIYCFCIETMKQVELFIRNNTSKQSKQEYNIQWRHTSPIRILSFHLAMLIVVKMLGKNDYILTDIESLLKVNLESEIISQTLYELIELTDQYADSRPSQSINTIVKQKEFVKFLIEEFGKKLNSKSSKN